MRLVLAFLAFLLPAAAFGQSSPNWPLGYQPSMPEWNSELASKQDLAHGFLPLAGGVLTGATGGNQGAGTVNATGLFINGVPVTITVLPTGATVPRTPSAVEGDTINPLFFGPGGVPVDITGNTDAQPAINAAIVQACATNAIRTKSVHIPPGIYQIGAVVAPPANCSNLTIEADPNTVIFRASVANNPANTNIPLLLQWSTGNDNITVKNIKFDGNQSGGNVNTNGLVRVNGAAKNPRWIGNEIYNHGGTGLWSVSAGLITAGTLSAESAYLNTTLTFNATLPATVKVGAYLQGGHYNSGYYITGLTSNSMTVQKPLDDTMFINDRIQVTAAFTVSTQANTGALVIPTADTNGLAATQTIFHDLVKCIAPDTRIVSVQTNVSVTIDTPLNCPVAAGANIAAQIGQPGFWAVENYFHDLGLQLLNGGTATYTTSAIAHFGDTSLTFNCFSSGCNKVGPVPGNFTAPTGMPAGMPASNPVNAQTAINSTAGTFTLQFKNALTADVAAGTPIPFTVGTNTGKGYSIWIGFGIYWAQPGYRLLRNIERDVWLGYLISQTTDAVFEGNVQYKNFNEFQSASSVAPSGCLGVFTSVRLRLKDNWCFDTAGAGFELNHITDGVLDGNSIIRPGFDGIGISGGTNILITNSNRVVNAGSYKNHPIVWVPPLTGNTGLQLSGSITAARIGALTGLIVNAFSAGDDQVTPTANYGLSMSNHNSLLLNAQYSVLNLYNNITLPTDPFLNVTPPAPGTDNRIVNPCMAIDQSNEGAVIAASSAYGPDQWQTVSSPNRIHYQRTATAQNGCATSLKMFVASTGSTVATDIEYVLQPIEVGDLLDLRYGTVAAASVVVDFCAKTSTAGTYGWGLQTHFPSAGLKTYSSSYTTTGTTSQCFSFVVPGDTATVMSSGITNEGLSLSFDAGSGSNYDDGTCNTWHTGTASTNFFCGTGITRLSTLGLGESIEISAVRLYPATVDVAWVGLTPAPAPYTAQRYFGKTFPTGTAPAQNAGVSGANCSSYDNMALLPVPGFDWNYPQEMRTVPTITTFNPSAANANWRDTTAGADVVATINADGLQDNDQVLIGAAPVVPTTDNLCIHATASSRF